MSKKYMHIRGNSLSFLANSLPSERNKGFQPVLCLLPKYINKFFRGPGIYVFIQFCEASHTLDISVQVFGCSTLQRFSGRKERTFFLSFPNSLVNSYSPVPLLSAGFRSSQTSKPTPQDRISLTSFFKWMPQGSLEVFSKSSLLSQSMT